MIGLVDVRVLRLLGDWEFELKMGIKIWKIGLGSR